MTGGVGLGMTGTGGKILRCAQNDRGVEARNDNRGGARKDGGREGRFFAALRMTERVRNDKGKKLSFWGAAFLLPVILRSDFSTPCHSEERKRRRIFGTLLLRREKRFFAALRMTGGWRLRMTRERCCHSEERRFSSLSF